MRRDLPPLGPTLDLLRLLWRVDHALQRRSKRMGREFGVTGPQRLALRLVGRFPGLPAGDLAALLHVHPGTLTGVLARLERNGLLTRRDDPRDRRRTLLGLTERGRALDGDNAVTIEAVVEGVLAATPAAERSAAQAFLLRLAESLEASLAKPAPTVRKAPRR